MILFITIPAGTWSASEKIHKVSGWQWTKENPKPVWWKWGDKNNKPVRGGYIHSAAGRYIGLMNPHHWPVNDWVSITHMYGGLMYINGEYKATFPWLAKSYEYPDDRTCIMKLRKGIDFHDGTPLNAESLKYDIDWILDKKSGAWDRAWVEPIESIEVIDEYTVKWHFKRPWPGFLGMMATVPGYIISKKALEGDVALAEKKKLAGRLKTAKKKLAKAEKKAEKARNEGGEKAEKAEKKLEKARKKAADLGKKYDAVSKRAEGAKSVDINPVGTGKYMLEDARPGNYLKLKRNPNWWFGKSVGIPEMPHPDGLIVTIIPDLSIRLANLRAGKLDILGLTPSQYKMAKSDRNLKITGQLGNHLMGLIFNHVKGPCKDIRVRKAISHAIDRMIRTGAIILI